MNGIQSIGSANLMSTLLSGSSQINNLKLSQALSGKSGVGSSSGASGSFVNGLSTDDSDFLKSYRSQMQELKESADAVLKGGNRGRLSAGAEDGGVAEVTGTLGSASDRYSLTVEQLASGQMNASTGLNSSDPMPTMGGALRIHTEKGSFELYMSAAGAKDNKEMLTNFAGRINAQKSGVTASVVEKDGVSTLELTGQSGAANSFGVSGSLAERLGLDQVSKAGQDAVYTVQKNGGAAERFTSASNTVTLDGKLSARLKGEGATGVKAGADAATGLADAVSNMVDTFNDTVGFLNSNSDRGVGVLYQMKRMVLPPTSEKSMAMAGITIRNDGTLKMDREAFLSKLKEDPSVVNSVVENIAKGVQADAGQGMRESSGSLLGISQVSQRQNDSMNSTLNMMNMYNRSGVYNLANYYAVGTLMNLNI